MNYLKKIFFYRKKYSDAALKNQMLLSGGSMKIIFWSMVFVLIAAVCVIIKQSQNHSHFQIKC